MSADSNDQAAAYFLSLYHANGLPRSGAEIMAVALDVYFTTRSLGGTLGMVYGLRADGAGLGAYL